MPKSYTKKRVKFLNKSEQRKFFQLIGNQVSGNKENIAKISGVGVRQISDWRNAKSTLSLFAFEKLILAYKIPRPRSIRIIDQYAYTSSAGKKGYNVTFKKYGGFPIDEVNRKIKWQKWWKTIGINKDQKILQRKTVHFPKRSSEFAELCGILIGDGGLTKRQMTITLNRETDSEYLVFVVRLLQKLFKLKPRVYLIKNSKAKNICIARTDLIDFLNKQGIVTGNKIRQHLSIPEWIMKSNKYLIRCIRGMVDTDGSVVIETHRINGKKYIYRRLNFSSASPRLIDQVHQTLKKMGFNSKIRSKGRAVQLENFGEICEYFKRIGTSNPKHLRRFGKLTL